MKNKNSQNRRKHEQGMIHGESLDNLLAEIAAGKHDTPQSAGNAQNAQNKR